MYAKMGLLPSARKLFDEMEMKDVPTWNSLISEYAKNGNVEKAFKLFSEMPSRNVIPLTAMICGCSQNGKYADALTVYKEMEKVGGVKPNEVKISSVLPACVNLGALEVGEKIEVYARASGYFKNMFVCNAVLEMYTKCVRIDRAMQLFHEIGRRRNLCSWNAMIMGLAVHGKSDEALKLFNQMLVSLCKYSLCSSLPLLCLSNIQLQQQA
ncbi:Pentatricopeptide repeat-containing protein [Capsicum annuum]|nr:Pentatricopeptide repeat-containing protein [Capsicum annuum]